MSDFSAMKRDFHPWWLHSNISVQFCAWTPRPVISAHYNSVSNFSGQSFMDARVAIQSGAYITSPYWPVVPRSSSPPSVGSLWSDQDTPFQELYSPSNLQTSGDYVFEQCRSRESSVTCGSSVDAREAIEHRPQSTYLFRRSESFRPVQDWLDTIRDNGVEENKAEDAGDDRDIVSTTTSRACTYTPTEIDSDHEQRSGREKSTTLIGDPTDSTLVFPGYEPGIPLPRQNPVWTRSDWTVANRHALLPISVFDNDVRFAELQNTAGHLDGRPTPLAGQNNRLKRRRAEEEEDIAPPPHLKTVKREHVTALPLLSSQAPHERRDLDLAYLDRALEEVARQRRETEAFAKQGSGQDWKQMASTLRRIWY